jgi:uncharacterized membrane protein
VDVGRGRRDAQGRSRPARDDRHAQHRHRASSVLFVASLKYAGVAVGSVLSSTAPVFALPLGVLFLGERIAVFTVVGVLLALAGIVVLQL